MASTDTPVEAGKLVVYRWSCARGPPLTTVTES